MDLEGALWPVVDFFVRPFVEAVERWQLEDVFVRIGFNNIEWFGARLDYLVGLVGEFIILYIFFRFIYKILKTFIKMLTGGMRL